MSRKTHISQLKTDFSKTYDEHSDAIFRYAYFKLSDTEKAKDVVQDTFVKFWEYISAEAESELQNTKALLYRIALNTIIDLYRKRKTFSLDTLADDGFDPTYEPEKDVFERHESEAVLKAINELPEGDRDIMFMRYVEGLSFDDIAESVGDRPNTIAVRVHRLLKQLRQSLNVNEEQ
jgi:RNA polymerase sigma-70 factor, ECF subfamily